MRIFTITYDVLLHYYDEKCSHENWSLLLRPPLTENSGGLGAYQVLQQSVEKGNFKR